MGRGFESHRGHEKESQMTCDEPFGFFVYVNIVGVLLYGLGGRSFLERHRKVSYVQAQIIVSMKLTIYEIGNEQRILRMAASSQQAAQVRQNSSDFLYHLSVILKF